MRNHFLPVSLCTSLVAGGLLAQSVPYTDAAPKVFTGTFAGSTNLFPFARSGGLIQYWWRKDNFRPGQVVTAVGARPSATLVGTPTTLNSVEIKMSNTTNPFTTTYASNFGPNVTTVFTAKPVSMPAQTPPNSFDKPMLWLTADNIFVALGQNVVCQFDLGTAVGAISLTHVADSFLMSALGSVLNKVSGTSCGSGILVANSTISSTYSVQLSGAPANSPAALLLGLDHTRLGGAVALPYKLDSLGLTGCFLGVDALATLNVLTDGTGGYFLSLPLGTAPADAVILYAQAAHPDVSKPAGWATTNVTHTLLGGVGNANYAYNFTADGPTAQYGPYATSRGPVILFK